MYLISIIALAFVTILMCMVSGLSIQWLLDMPTLLLLLLISLPIIISAGLLRDLNNAFRFVIRKKTEKSLKELRRSVEAVSLAIKTFLWSGILLSIIQMVVILGRMDSLETLGPMLCVSVLSVLYGVGISLLLLPLRTSLQVQIIEFLSEEE